jgi:leucyl aminopeptidase
MPRDAGCSRLVTHREFDTMHTAFRSPAITLTSQPSADLHADLLVIPVFSDDDFSDEAALDAASGGDVQRAKQRGELTGKPFEVLATTTAFANWKTPRALLVGAGSRKDVTADHLRRIAIVGGLSARQRRLPRVTVIDRAGMSVSADDAAQAIAEGLCLANYDGASYRTGGPLSSWIDAAQVRISSDGAGVPEALERGHVLGDFTNQARALANAPGNELTPRIFAERAQAIAKDAGLGVEILDEEKISALKMGMLLGVARGSQEPPRLVALRHDPPNAVKGVVLGLVGKGITFDTGGISIKPADNMDKMKDDMSGGAAVICAMSAIARLKVPVRVVAVVPMTENMPGGKAFKPGDVLTSAAGKTVEIINTDAEGRLILGDGLWYARELGATHLVDVATLTGACVVALGKTTTGLFGSPSGWVEAVRRASGAGGRSFLANAGVRRLQGSTQERDRRLHQHRRPAGRRNHRSALPEGVRRRTALGAHGHRWNRVGRGGEAVSAQGRNGSRRSHAGRACAGRDDVERAKSQELMFVLNLLQDKPIIVDVGKPAEPTPDISLDFVVGMFAMAGIFLLVALVGSLIVAGVILVRKRRQQRLSPDDQTHTTLRI